MRPKPVDHSLCVDSLFADIDLRQGSERNNLGVGSADLVWKFRRLLDRPEARPLAQGIHERFGSKLEGTAADSTKSKRTVSRIEDPSQRLTYVRPLMSGLMVCGVTCDTIDG